MERKDPQWYEQRHREAGCQGQERWKVNFSSSSWHRTASPSAHSACVLFLSHPVQDNDALGISRVTPMQPSVYQNRCVLVTRMCQAQWETREQWSVKREHCLLGISQSSCVWCPGNGWVMVQCHTCSKR